MGTRGVRSSTRLSVTGEPHEREERGLAGYARCRVDGVWNGVVVVVLFGWLMR